MKLRYLSLLSIILLIPVCVWAWGVLGISGGVTCTEATGNACGEGFETTSGTACQGFDEYGGGTWTIACYTDGGTIDEDYTTRVNCGSESLFCGSDNYGSANGVARVTFTKVAGTVDPIYFTVDFYIERTLIDDDKTYVISFISAAGEMMRVYFKESGAGTLELEYDVYYDSAMQDVGDSAELSIDTWYELSLYYNYDAGAGGAYEIKLDDNSEYSGSSLSNTRGPMTYFRLGPYTDLIGEETDWIWDRLDIDTAGYVR